MNQTSYYYYLDGNLIIPMIYDMGYEEKDFGVKDGVSKPFDDTNPNFLSILKYMLSRISISCLLSRKLKITWQIPFTVYKQRKICYSYKNCIFLFYLWDLHFT